MEFGSCSTNSALMFVTIKDIDNSIIRFPYSRDDVTVEDLKEYYMKTSRFPTKI